jgi:hypothetical protein
MLPVKLYNMKESKKGNLREDKKEPTVNGDEVKCTICLASL